MNFSYGRLFERNLGIFSFREQERIRRSRVLIVGCGGIGGTVAVMLARAGVEGFILVDFDVYSLTNMNRQAGCFDHTLGLSKAKVIGDMILRINPEARVDVYDRLLSHEEIARLMENADLVFPAADDFAFSLFVFRDARRLRKPALLVVPSGTWAHAGLILPGGPPPEAIEGVPVLSSCEELRDTLEIRKFKLGTYFYTILGNWRIGYYRAFVEGEARPAQICPTVWASSALGALEVLKHLSGRWPPVASPRYWEITRDRIAVRKVNGLSLQTLLVWQRRVMWGLFHTPLAPLQEKLQSIWWNAYCRWGSFRERKRETAGPVAEGNREYGDLFCRNLGILTPKEQEKIRKTRVLIAGDSGTGETLAVLLARCGFERFLLTGDGTYEEGDMNRQIGCFTGTVGRRKLEVVEETLRSINPAVRVETRRGNPAPEEMDGLVSSADLVVPAVDDLPYSVLLFRSARRCGKTALLCMPSGTMGWVSTFPPRGPSLEKMLGIPDTDLGVLRNVMKTAEYRCAQYHYITEGDWRVDWFSDYFRGKRPLPLLCPVEWLLVSLGALEAMKYASGRWEPLSAPRCWRMKNGLISVSRFSRFISWHRRLGFVLFGSERGIRSHKLTHLFWKHLFRFLKSRQKQPEKKEGLVSPSSR
ncbi:MAG TPA: ThiF family adenylyltransferase [Syntrophales bacterium]|nr:ThiF family adenylyltransferase [Syntrophales bacterium]